jgi:hypothetical protein
MLDDLIQEAPDRSRLTAIRARLLVAERPVRALPSDAVLFLLLMAGFVALAVVGAIPFGFPGFHLLTAIQKIILYAAVLLSAGLLSAGVVEQMIPGSRWRIYPALAVLFPLIALGAIVPLLFPNFGMADFVSRGMPCLRLGLICAAPSAFAVGLLMRRGFLTTPFSAVVTAAALSGLVGVATLSLHCPVLNTPHILVWHAGVVVITVAVGAIAGYILQIYPRRNRVR